ncbi:MAG: hypothetical protein JWR63_3090, partial [Conexibacter sp.]|nr:hypothetical protein [Conexibacter sp.]
GAAVPASDPVAKAAALAATQTGGVTIKMRGTVAANGVQQQLSGGGTVDRRNGRGMFTLATKINGHSVPIREVMDGRSIYVTSKLFTNRLPGKRSWMRINLAQAAKTTGFDLSALGTNGPSQDPAQILAYLKGAGASKKLGTEKVGGVQTTHYGVTVDLKQARAKSGSKAAKAAIDQLIKTLGSDTTVPVEVWVDAQHRVRRERVSYDATIRNVQTGLDFTTDFTAFGVPVKVAKPAAGDTVDGLALLKKSGALAAAAKQQQQSG